MLAPFNDQDRTEDRKDKARSPKSFRGICAEDFGSRPAEDVHRVAGFGRGVSVVLHRAVERELDAQMLTLGGSSQTVDREKSLAPKPSSPLLGPSQKNTEPLQNEAEVDMGEPGAAGNESIASGTAAPPDDESKGMPLDLAKIEDLALPGYSLAELAGLRDVFVGPRTGKWGVQRRARYGANLSV
ncbi:hypothetical protein H0H81_010406 [Sphagnurus paluster]|uniref:Uncharacterized protein n=1 Tax=Sphagnurus paluster TaxID=117069 RepID=A0A9P7FSZ5_9AGAR|nr:hypothetical protein H0H81_010406 [Sphagnurus paluster]